MTRELDAVGNSWFVVCKHLVNHQSQDWNEVGDPLQGYVCAECLKQGPENLSPDDLEPLAAESVKMLRASH